MISGLISVLSVVVVTVSPDEVDDVTVIPLMVMDAAWVVAAVVSLQIEATPWNFSVNLSPEPHALSEQAAYAENMETNVKNITVRNKRGFIGEKVLKKWANQADSADKTRMGSLSGVPNEDGSGGSQGNGVRHQRRGIDAIGNPVAI
jgi:hypothetical protein